MCSAGTPPSSLLISLILSFSYSDPLRLSYVQISLAGDFSKGRTGEERGVGSLPDGRERRLSGRQRSGRRLSDVYLRNSVSRREFLGLRLCLLIFRKSMNQILHIRHRSPSSRRRNTELLNYMEYDGEVDDGDDEVIYNIEVTANRFNYSMDDATYQIKWMWLDACILMGQILGTINFCSISLLACTKWCASCFLVLVYLIPLSSACLCYDVIFSILFYFST